jgi:hypothetical protein
MSRPPHNPRLATDRALKILAARPDVRVISHFGADVQFAILRHVVAKQVVNEDGFSPLTREHGLFYVEFWELRRAGKDWKIEEIAKGSVSFGDAEEIVREALGDINPKVAEKLRPAPKKNPETLPKMVRW